MRMFYTLNKTEIFPGKYMISILRHNSNRTGNETSTVRKTGETSVGILFAWPQELAEV
jgi:hypothetical protein